MKYRCAYCGKTRDKAAGHVNRSSAAGLRLYCNRRCSGLGRRTGKTVAQKREEKRLYDIVYQAKNREKRKAQKREHHHLTYDPVAAAAYRKKRMHLHVKYCQRPEYKRWKKAYDRKHRANKFFGPFAEAAMLLNDLNLEINRRMDRHEVRYQNGTTNKAQRRKREGRQEERGRNAAGRRTGHPTANGR
jgi:hypothetical protein